MANYSPQDYRTEEEPRLRWALTEWAKLVAHAMAADECPPWLRDTLGQWWTYVIRMQEISTGGSKTRSVATVDELAQAFAALRQETAELYLIQHQFTFEIARAVLRVASLAWEEHTVVAVLRDTKPQRALSKGAVAEILAARDAMIVAYQRVLTAVALYGDRVRDGDADELRLLNRDASVIAFANTYITHSRFHGKPDFEAFRAGRPSEEAARDACLGGLGEALNDMDLLDMSVADDRVTVRPRLDLLGALQRLTYSKAWKFVREQRGREVSTDTEDYGSTTSDGPCVDEMSADTAAHNLETQRQPEDRSAGRPTTQAPSRRGDDIIELARCRTDDLIKVCKEEGVFRKPVDEDIFRGLLNNQKQRDIAGELSMTEGAISKRKSGIMSRLGSKRMDIVVRFFDEMES